MSLPPDLHRPDYGVGTLADLLPGVATTLGVQVERDGMPADPLGLRGVLGETRRVAVLLIDGLGADLVRASADLAPTLASMLQPVGDLSAPCPSTTPVSLASLGTGLPPGSHGILGFVTVVPEELTATGEGRTLNHIAWRADPDPDRWQPRRTVFEQVAAAGVAVTVVAPHSFQGSGLTRAVYRGADYPGSVGPGDVCAAMAKALTAGPRALVYGYLSELDLTGHVRGVDSDAWRAQLALVDRTVEQLLARLPEDAALLVTGDHGMLDIPTATRLDLDRAPDLAEGVRLLAGEPRARYLHTEDGAADDVLHRWREVLGERVWVVSREEAIASGIFGTVDLAHTARIGDVVALARGTWALVATKREPGASALVGYHGSLTSTEVAIPLLVARGSALG